MLVALLAPKTHRSLNVEALSLWRWWVYKDIFSVLLVGRIVFNLILFVFLMITNLFVHILPLSQQSLNLFNLMTSLNFRVFDLLLNPIHVNQNIINSLLSSLLQFHVQMRFLENRISHILKTLVEHQDILLNLFQILLVLILLCIKQYLDIFYFLDFRLAKLRIQLFTVVPKLCVNQSQRLLKFYYFITLLCYYLFVFRVDCL